MMQTISQDTTALKNWLSAGGLKEQIARTVYDEQYGAGSVITPYITQINLRNRVSYVQAIDVENSAYPAATYYSYDVHGNGDTVLHDYGANSMMGTAGNEFKLIKYDYDLISGKVNMVSYQPNRADGFYQQYKYDAENRLMAVLTSRDSILWQQDATYRYYRHGPLARVELGDLKVQGVDYAYTLQGWLKSINPSYNNISNDLYDEDGTTTASAKDAYKLNLNYYDDGVYSDYKPINAPAGYVQGNTLPLSARMSLYNGNISSIATNIRALNQPLLYNYQYDQLNRLVSMDAWASNGLFSAIGTSPMQDYAERYSYDPNGNILTNKRWGKNRQLDDATYHYVADKNQLTYISDVAGKPTGNDIEGNQTTTNYGFDLIGEMTSDVKRGLTAATWTVYGKIATQTVSNGTASGTITYTYDAQQNRISKQLTGAGGYTEWYVRDAQGNVLSIYRANDNSINSGHLTQTEVDVYGSSRIGELNTTLDVSSNLTQPTQTIFTRGSKTFELTEQRGNVLATISDKKLQVSTDNNQTVAYYNPDVITAQDYSSFGVIQDGRQYGTAPRFTYNGKQLDRELNWQDYGMRQSDAITGRFVSVDPLMNQYPELTPYQYGSNRPIDGIDLDGGEWGPPRGANGQIDNKAALDMMHANNEMAIGFYESGKETVKGLVRAVRHPVNTVTSLASAIIHPINTFNAIKEKYVQEFKDNTARASGKVGGEILQLFFGGELLKSSSLVKREAAITDAVNGAKTATTIAADDIKLQQVFEGAEDWNMISYQGTHLGDAILTNGTTLELDIIVPEALQKKGILTNVVKKAVQKFNPAELKSTWKYDAVRYKDFGGVSTNLKSFLENRTSLGDEAAAWSTPSGKAAKAAGFKNVNISVQTVDGKPFVQASFTK